MQQTDFKMKTYLNNSWQFFQDFSESIFDDNTQGVAVRLPHTNKQLPFNYFDETMSQFVSGYRCYIDADLAEGKTYLLTFEAVGHYAEVYVNGKMVSTHKSGYTAFTVDVTPHLQNGKNQIVVKADSRESVDQPPFGFVIDYLTYGGMYREAYLDIKQGAYITDVFVQALPGEPIHADIQVEKFTVGQMLYVSIYDGENIVATAHKDVSSNLTQFDITLQSQILWDIDNPHLYKFVAQIGEDIYQTNFGIRKAVFTPNGFYLNDKKIKLVGLDRHQSYAYVGYAMPESMQRYDAQIMKNQLGLNIVRTSHYPQSQYFIDECDKLGLLVFTEIPGWQHIGGKEWQDVAVENVREMVVQYRNHPSIILWGVRINESLDNDDLYKRTNALSHSLDSTRQTGGVRYFQKSHLLEDVYTYNDFKWNGAADRDQVCDKNAPYLITEYNGHMYPTKTFDDASHRREHMWRYAKKLNDVFGDDRICGAIGWCLFDYNTHKDFGSGDKICYHGVLDMFRNPKDASYIFNSFGKKPFVKACFTTEIGDYPGGDIGDMYVMTNCDYIKLYKGKNYITTFDKTHSPFKNLPHPPILVDDLVGDLLVTEQGLTEKQAKLVKQIMVDVKNLGIGGIPFSDKIRATKIMMQKKWKMQDLVKIYNKYYGSWGGEANQITIEGYIDNKLVATQKIATMSTWTLKATPSATTLTEGNTYDVALVQIEAIDNNGTRVPYVNCPIHLEASGSIEVIGPSDFALQGGVFGTYVKTTGKGNGTLKVNNIELSFEVK